MGRLDNKTALVTGASKGIGRAIARGLADEGADVVVHYNTDSEGAADLVANIRKAGRNAFALPANIGRVSDVCRLFETVHREVDRLDVLVNNAAVTGWADLFDVTEEKWDEIVDTNLKGTFFCALEAAKLMREQGGGTIVNVSTNVASMGVRNLGLYAISKGALWTLTRQLAVDLAPYHIRVNTFAPGPTRVERNLHDDPEYNAVWGSVIPLGRTADPEEMVGTAVFLASDDSRFITGQVFNVDGGWSVAGAAPENYLAMCLRKNG